MKRSSIKQYPEKLRNFIFVFGFILTTNLVPRICISQEAVPSEWSTKQPFEIYNVSDWQLLIPSRLADFRFYKSAIFSSSDYSPERKHELVMNKYHEIEKEISALRTELYSNYSQTLTIGNSCTNEGRDASKNCRANCIRPSVMFLYAKPDWTSGAYASGYMPANSNIFNNSIGNTADIAETLISNGEEICAVKLKQSGIGRKVSFTQTTFKIRPNKIEDIVNWEMSKIMMNFALVE